MVDVLQTKIRRVIGRNTRDLKKKIYIDLLIFVL